MQSLFQLLQDRDNPKPDKQNKATGSISGISQKQNSNYKLKPIPKPEHPYLVKGHGAKATASKTIVTRGTTGEGAFKSRQEFWGGYDKRWRQTREIIISKDTPDAPTSNKKIIGGTLVSKTDVPNPPIDQISGKRIKDDERIEIDHPAPQSILKRRLTHPEGEETWPKWVLDKWGPSISKAQARDIKNERRVLQTTSSKSNQLKSNKGLMDYHPEYGWGNKETPLAHKPEVQGQKYHDALLFAAKQTGKPGVMTREEGYKYMQMTGKEPTVPGWDNPEHSPPAYAKPTVGKDYIQKPVRRTQNVEVTQPKTPYNPKPDTPLSVPSKPVMTPLPKAIKQVKEVKKVVTKKPAKKKSPMSEIQGVTGASFRWKKKKK
jgi:hypothetical protein